MQNMTKNRVAPISGGVYPEAFYGCTVFTIGTVVTVGAISTPSIAGRKVSIPKKGGSQTPLPMCENNFDTSSNPLCAWSPKTD